MEERRLNLEGTELKQRHKTSVLWFIGSMTVTSFLFELVFLRVPKRRTQFFTWEHLLVSGLAMAAVVLVTKFYNPNTARGNKIRDVIVGCIAGIVVRFMISF